jgi:DNA helicase HerA-like ATPase
MAADDGRPDTPRAHAAEPPYRPIPLSFLQELDQEIAQAGGEWHEGPEYAGSVGRTMFDTPQSEDNTVTVLLPPESIGRVPSQSLLRIRSVKDGRSYLGVVVKGPFAEPDGLRADAPLIVATTVRGGIFMPRYHGRVQVELLGEEISRGESTTLVPPRFRPLPNSPVFSVSADESARVLRASGSLRLGLAVGHEQIVVGLSPSSKDVLPRHTAILGTTGSGKSTTVARLIYEAQAKDFAVVLLDVEGEYAFLNEPAATPAMRTALAERGLPAAGVPDSVLYHLAGRACANPRHPRRAAFSLAFERLSPYAIKEILDLTDAQEQRFFRAYDVARQLLRDLGVFPRRDEHGTTLREDEERLLEYNEFDTGYPGMRLEHVLDVAGEYLRQVSKQEREPVFRTRAYQANPQLVVQRVKESKSDHEGSWRALAGRLWRLARLGVFDRPDAGPLSYQDLLKPGRVSVIDLSDTDSPELNNLVIADLLRGVQQAQETAYAHAEQSGRRPPRTLVIIEEAHEFLSEERIGAMPVLFEQVARIAKRGRKRWLGLVFVTQLPQHLPRQLFGLVNNYVLHKLSDIQVINQLQRTLGGIDPALWSRLPALAPGQAIVSFAGMTRPLLVAIDPAPCKLRMVE